MGHITFKDRSELQARFLMYKAHEQHLPKTNDTFLQLAVRYAEKLANKIDNKYLTLNLKGTK